VVYGKHCHRRVEAVVAERQVFGARLDRRSRTRRSLGNHLCRGLDRSHLAVCWLIRAGSSADVDDRARVTERRVDAGGDPWVGATDLAVTSPNPIIGRLSCLHAYAYPP
jgi:hypothetical protein